MSVWWHLLRGRREKGSSETTGPVSDVKHSGMSPIRAAVWETKAGSQQQGNVCGLKKKCVCAYHVVSNWQLRPYVDSFEGPETENLVSQSPHLAWGAMAGSGGGLLLYFPFKRTFSLNVFSAPRETGISPPVLRSTEGRGNSNLQKPKLNMTYDNSLLYGPEIQRHTSLKKCPEKRSLIQVDLNCTSNVALPLIASFTVWHKTN